MKTIPKIRLFTFAPNFGLPTAGPFGLKLEVCLRMMGVPYERVVENDNRKGPKRKSPWIEDGAVRLGDSELVLAYLSEKYGVSVDDGATALERARGHVVRRAFEEHYHQVFEYELVVHDGGWPYLRAMLAASVPGPLLPIVAPLARSSFKKHLFERGIARHAPKEIETMGRADIDAFAALLGDQPYFGGEAPTKTDATAFGLLAVSILGPLPGPVCTHARSKEPLVRYVHRMRDRFFPELAAEHAPAQAAQ
jgi:glutathione S-transferase